MGVLPPDGRRRVMRNVRFSRGGWKVMLVTVTILALILTGMFTLSLKEPAVAKAEVDKAEVESAEIEALVKKAALIFATAVPHDKLLASSATVVEIKITDNNGVEAIVNTERTFVLDYKSAYDEPYLKGKTKWLSENESKLSPAEVNVAKTEMKGYADWVQWEMQVPSTIYAPYKLIASSLEEARNGNFTVYLWTDIDRVKNGTVQNWIPNNIFIPTDEEATNKAYETFGDYIEQLIPVYAKAEQTAIERGEKNQNSDDAKQTESISPFVNMYNYAGAANYARTYTSNTTATRMCSNGVIVKQDPSYYNGYYYYLCADCANYVSQALHIGGGIPTDSVWYPISGVSCAWNNVYGTNGAGIVPYFSSLGWISQSNYESVQPGDFLVMNSSSHIMMVTAKDLSGVQASAHTDDVRNQPIANNYTKTFYHVLPTAGGIQ